MHVVGRPSLYAHPPSFDFIKSDEEGEVSNWKKDWELRQESSPNQPSEPISPQRECG